MVEKIINNKNFDIELFRKSSIVKNYNDERLFHLKKSIEHISIDGSVLEFGVFDGNTLNFISCLLKNDTCWGFDSFEGLPENWITDKNKLKIKFKKGHFKTNIPIVNKNVKLVKGYYNETLSDWVKNNLIPIKFLHIDCDLYSSTKTIFQELNSIIVTGTVIVFDEMYHWSEDKYNNWKEGEYKALQEWLTEYNREITIIHRNTYMQCAIKVIK